MNSVEGFVRQIIGWRDLLGESIMKKVLYNQKVITGSIQKTNFIMVRRNNWH